MSKLQKMSIQGIRSFGPDDTDKQVITFFSPLTLILGPNGTGKTTIIECLKYMTTGEMPPGGRKDGAFIHDPKVANETEVKAKIILQFSDVKGQLVNAHRNLVGTQKLKRVEMKTVDSLITRWNADGEKVSISNRCAEMDREMVSLLGVSKAVLDNVIFCHQEEANWPLSEGKALKQKFDDIFASTRYVKALESIKKCRQAQVQVISHCATEIKYLKQNKDRAEQIKSDLQEKDVQYSASKESIEQIQQQLIPLEEKLDMLQNRSREVIQLQTEIEKLKSEKSQMEKTQAELRDAIEHEFTGSSSELQQLLKDFKGKYLEQQRALKENEAQLVKVENKMDALNREKSTQLLDLGKMKQDAERHEQQTKKRDNLIRSLADEYRFEGFEGRMAAEHVRRLVSLLEDQAKTCLDQATATRTKYEQQETELQLRIDEERSKKTALETSRTMKTNSLKQNTVEVRGIKQQLNNAAVSAHKLDDVRRDIRTTEEELKDTEDSVDVDALRSQVSALQKQKEELDVSRKRLDAEMNRMSLESTVRTQLSVYRKDKTAKDEHIRRLKAKNDESILHLLGDVSGCNLRHTLDDYTGRQSKILRDTSTKLKHLMKRLAQVETDRTNQMDFLSRKEEEYRGYEQKIFNVCESQNFDEGLEKVDTKMKQSQDTLGYLKGTEHVYKKYKTQLQRGGDPPCPLCHRPFDSPDEVDELVTELDSKLNLVPAKLERVISEHDKFKSKYEMMLQLKPVREAMAHLTENELPRLKTKVKALSEEVQELKTDISQMEEKQEVEEMDFATATSLQPDVMMIDRYEVEARELDKKIAMQASKLSTGADSERSMQQVTSERETVNISLDSVSVSLERTRDKLSNHSERVQQLKSSLNELMSECLSIQQDLQRRTQLEDKRAELENACLELTDEIKEAERKLQPLARRIAELSREKEQLGTTKETQVDKEKSKLAKVNECKSDMISRQEEIKRYERDGKREMLEECKENLNKLEEKAEQLCSTRDQVAGKIAATRQKLDTQKTQERELEDNMQLRRRQVELEAASREMGALEEQLGGLDVGNLEQERRSLVNQHNKLQEKKSHAEGRLHGLRDQMKQFKRDLEGDYKNAEKKYMDMKIDLRTTELAKQDLDKYYTALDRAVMSYHKTKMAEINKIIREIWKNTYRGNDIETIEIRSDEEENSGSARRIYNYRVVMVKAGDTVLDMRGRCSAGQKVLSSLIIRLALAETFCLNCGILALDEPTTNLDRENIESLAQALVQIIKSRSRQCNFQLVVITHDEDFVELLGRCEYVEYFYKVGKNAKGCSQLARARVEELSR